MTVPPVRERDGDVELLSKFLIDHYNREFRKQVRGIAPRALNALNAHAWPGNVRELKNVIERAVLLCKGAMLEAEDIGALVREEAQKTKSPGFRLPASGLDLHELEVDLVIQALERTGGNQTRAAALLGLNRDQIRYRMAKFGLKPLRPARTSRTRPSNVATGQAADMRAARSKPFEEAEAGETTGHAGTFEFLLGLRHAPPTQFCSLVRAGARQPAPGFVDRPVGVHYSLACPAEWGPGEIVRAPRSRQSRGKPSEPA